MMISVVVSQCVSRPECSFAEVAGDDNSLDVIGFNVIFYGVVHPFLSTYFALMKCVYSIGVFLLAFLHH